MNNYFPSSQPSGQPSSQPSNEPTNLRGIESTSVLMTFEPSQHLDDDNYKSLIDNNVLIMTFGSFLFVIIVLFILKFKRRRPMIDLSEDMV